MVIKYLKINDLILEYTIHFEARRSLSMRFRDEKLVVKAPLNIPLKLLDDWIESKKDWILRQYRVQQTLNLNEDEMWFLNKKIKLEYHEAVHFAYTLSDGIIHVYHPKRMLKQNAYLRMRMDLAEKIILPIYQAMVEHTGLQAKSVSIKSLKRSWGRCDSKQHIRLNERLIECDPRFIEYVCVHELMHLKHMNHSKQFYASIEKILPDYQKRRRLTPYQYAYLT